MPFLQSYYPQIGFTRDLPRGCLSTTGRRMLSHEMNAYCLSNQGGSVSISQFPDESQLHTQSCHKFTGLVSTSSSCCTEIEKSAHNEQFLLFVVKHCVNSNDGQSSLSQSAWGRRHCVLYYFVAVSPYSVLSTKKLILRHSPQHRFFYLFTIYTDHIC